MTNVVGIIDKLAKTVTSLSDRIRTLERRTGIVTAYGELWTVAGNTVASVTSSGFTQVTAFDNNGTSRRTTVDHTGDDITIDLLGTHTYLVSFHSSVQIDTANRTVILAVFVDGVAQDNISASHEMPTTALDQSLSACGLLRLTKDEVVDLRVSTDAVLASTITFSRCNLFLTKVS